MLLDCTLLKGSKNHKLSFNRQIHCKALREKCYVGRKKELMISKFIIFLNM